MSDRRVQRTRRTLRESLIALILERGWERVSVQDICDHADVGRSTFYMHFADKEELLVGGFAELRKMLRADLTTSAEPSPSPFPFVLGMLDHARENHRLFLALVGKRSGQLVLQHFRELVLDLIREDLGRLPAKGQLKEALVHFVGGAFLELLTWWLEAKNPLLPAEMERIFLRMALPALKLVQ